MFFLILLLRKNYLNSVKTWNIKSYQINQWKKTLLQIQDLILNNKENLLKLKHDDLTRISKLTNNRTCYLLLITIL